jgi:hypothetical protein
MEPSALPVVYEVVAADRTDGHMVAQFGAFIDRAEAEKVLAQLDSEGRHGALALNAVPVYATANDWENDR